MSDWRCAKCMKILNSNWEHEECCGGFYPDESWTNLSVDESEVLRLTQELKESREMNKGLLAKIAKLQEEVRHYKHEELMRRIDDTFPED